MRFASPRKTCPHWPPLWQRRALSGGMKRAPQASFRARGSPLAPWAGFLAKMKPISLADCYAASCFYITAWKWNAAAFSSRAAFFWNIAWARCFARQSAMRAKKAASPCAPPWARRGFPFTGGLWGILGRNFRHFPPRQAGLSLAAFPGVSPGGHPAARIGPQFPLRASHQRALTPHCTKQRAASVHCGCRAPLSLSRASVRFALQGVKPAFSFAFLFFARKDPLAPFRHISASRRHAPPAFFIFPPHVKAAARRQKQSLSLPQSSCPLRAGAAAGGCALHFGPGGSAG